MWSKQIFAVGIEETRIAIKPRWLMPRMWQSIRYPIAKAAILTVFPDPFPRIHMLSRAKNDDFNAAFCQSCQHSSKREPATSPWVIRNLPAREMNLSPSPSGSGRSGTSSSALSAYVHLGCAVVTGRSGIRTAFGRGAHHDPRLGVSVHLSDLDDPFRL